MTKSELIKKGKELGLNLNTKMSKYELEHRIKDTEESSNKPKEVKSTKKANGGEY